MLLWALRQMKHRGSVAGERDIDESDLARGGSDRRSRAAGPTLRRWQLSDRKDCRYANVCGMLHIAQSRRATRFRIGRLVRGARRSTDRGGAAPESFRQSPTDSVW